MRTISGLIMRVDPFDCPAGKDKPDCTNCSYRVGRVRVSLEGRSIVRCCWDEEQKEEKK